MMRVRAVFLSLCLIFTALILTQIGVLEADGNGVDVVINEIMYVPEGSDTGKEWIELYNNGTTTVNITNWVITDQEGGDDFIFPEIIFPPDSYIVIFTGQGINDTDFENGTAFFYMWRTSTMFEDTGDDILLKNNSGDGVDYVAFDFGSYVDPCPLDLNWDDLNPWANEGNSISLHPNGIDTDSGLCWEESDPTPGRTNAHLDDDPPEIKELRHSPSNPKSSEAVTITTNVTDDHNLKSITLLYCIDETSHFSIPMSYDGSNYTAQIPAQAEGTVIEYHVNANDDAEQNTTSPQYCYAHSDSPIRVVINEFLASPVDWDDEFIELYNLGDTLVNIGGWEIDDILGSIGSSPPYVIPQGTVIFSKEFLVLYGKSTEILLNNNGDNVTLLNEMETIIDIHVYQTSKEDTTIGRFPDGTEDWKDFLLPTPGACNQYTVDSLGNLSNIKINEFLSTPKTVYDTEWIELYNDGQTPVRLDGCWLDDTLNGGKKPWQIPLNTTIEPGGILYFNRSFGLNNDGDSVNLLYVDGTTVIDTYTYDSSEYDVSFGRRTDGGDNWASFSYPTPGQSNLPYQEPNSSERSIVITELFYRASEDIEFICLYNPSNMIINLSGWRICDGQNSYSGSILFPENTMMPPLNKIYIAYKASYFWSVMGFYPDFEYGNFSASIPQMIRRNEPSFAIQKDEALLLDEFGTLIDIMVYGDSEYEGLGWTGSPIPDAEKGEVLKRNFDEDNLKYHDTNTSLDWKHIRHYKLGQSDLECEDFIYTGNMTLFASPDSSYETIIKEIENAKSTIYISLYQFTNWNISEKVIEKLNNGVEVKILIEGGAAGEKEEEQKYVLQKVHENGGVIRFLVHNSTLGSRYRYVHAKYAIIDGISIIISSENWKYTGMPLNSTFGNRGWGVVIRDTSIAGYFTDVFLTDWDSVEYDIIPFIPDNPDYGNASSDFELDEWIETGYYEPVFPSVTLVGEFAISPVISPDSTLLESEAILGIINSATESIYIEQLDVELNWNDDELEYENLYLKAAIEAAEQREVDVKILLSSIYAYPDNPGLDNYDTYIYINDYASNHNLTDRLETRLVDYDRLGLSKVHNKGMIVDGNKTLISSINWNRNSVTQNREVGVIIESEEVAEYFTKIFLWDWNEPPAANAGHDITVNLSKSVQFEDSSFDLDDNIVSYYWDFGDGTNSTEKSPLHKYKKSGIYDVKLTVSDGQYQDSDSITVIVHEAEKEEGFILPLILVFIFIIIIFVIVVFIRRLRLQFI